MTAPVLPYGRGRRRRSVRWLLARAAIVVLTLADVCFAALWVRSYWRTDELCQGSHVRSASASGAYDRTLSIGSTAGGVYLSGEFSEWDDSWDAMPIQLAAARYESDTSAALAGHIGALQARLASSGVDLMPIPVWRYAGFNWDTEDFEGIGVIRFFVVPDYLLMLIVSGALWLVVRANRRWPRFVGGVSRGGNDGDAHSPMPPK